MKKITYLLFTVCFFALSFSAKAQCNYTLEMHDSYDDGWNGGIMDVLVNGVVVLDDVGFLSNEGFPTGETKTVAFTANTGDDVTTVFVDSGEFPEEITYSIIAFDGTVAGSGDATTNITTGTITASCPTCSVPQVTYTVVGNCPIDDGFYINVDITDIGSATSVTITDDQGTTALANVGVGTYAFGTYANAASVVVSVANNDDGICTNTSTNLTFIGVCSDECADAIAVACDDVVSGSTLGATDSIGNPSADVWYSYTGTGAIEDITASLCNSGYDTNMRVYDACGGAQIAANDDFCGTNGWRSQVTFTSDGTSTYYILIEGYDIEVGDYEMSITCEANIPAPDNDELASATSLVIGTPLIGETTVGATQSAGEQPVCDPFGFVADVWYAFIAPVSGEVTITTTITGSSDQANMAVYNNNVVEQVYEEDCSNDNGGESLVLTGLTSGNTYYVRVWSDGATSRRLEGTFDISAVDATLSMPNSDNQGFTYFPNPVKQTLYLQSQSNIQEVSVYNMLGQEIIKTAPNTLESDLNMSKLSNGAYFVKVTINDRTETIRVVKH